MADVKEQRLAARGRWWEALCRKGDPMRRPHLAWEAFDAGYEAGKEAARPSDAVRRALVECADDLEALVEDHYKLTKDYPSCGDMNATLVLYVEPAPPSPSRHQSRNRVRPAAACGPPRPPLMLEK